MRFERRVDPEGADRAVARAAQLLQELAGARPTGTGSERNEQPLAWASRERVTIDPVRIQKLAAIDDLDAERQTALLVRAGCEVTSCGDVLEVLSPTWRGDLRRPADLAEEVLRLHGYQRIPARLPLVEVTGGLTHAQRLERQARTWPWPPASTRR
jgi:phenylalanyl-tRNA synthetase beta chain